MKLPELLRPLAHRLGYELRRLPVPDAAWRTGDLSLERLTRRVDGMTVGTDLALLARLAEQVSDGCIVEIGAYRGRSAIALAVGSWRGSRVPVFSIEPHEPFTGVLGGTFGWEDRAAFYQAMLDSGACRAVRLVNLPSTVAAGAWHLPIGLLWIDGDHREQAVRRDVDAWLPHLRPDAVVAFDDVDDPTLGPAKVVEDLVRDRGWVEVERTDKIAVLRRG
jgi:predicted O-methyltransferase YrrM